MTSRTLGVDDFVTIVFVLKKYDNRGGGGGWRVKVIQIARCHLRATLLQIFYKFDQKIPFFYKFLFLTLQISLPPMVRANNMKEKLSSPMENRIRIRSYSTEE